MNTTDFDRRLNDWFDSVDPKQIPPRIVSQALSQVADTGQIYGPLQRFAATIELAWRPRPALMSGIALVIITGLLIIALAAMGLAAGALHLPTSETNVVDGLIAVEDAQDPGHPSQRIRFIDPQNGKDVFSTPSSVQACAAHFSPDGSQYAFLQGDGSGQPSIAVAPATADYQPTLLFRKHSQSYFDASWAPDGSAFVTTMETADSSAGRQVWILQADGSRKGMLTNVSAAYFAGWSADGTWIAFVGMGPEHPLYIIRPNGSDLRMLVPGGVGSVAWSPVGEELAYNANDGKLHVLSVDGSEVIAIDVTTTSTDQIAGGLAWSPDGTKIALTPNGVSSIFDVGLGTRTELDVPGIVGRAIWSPTGQSLAVVTYDPTYLDQQTPSGQLWEVSPDGAPARLIADHVRSTCMSSGQALSWQRLIEEQK